MRWNYCVFGVCAPSGIKTKAGNTYKRNIQAFSRNNCRPGKAISITYSKCVSVALGIQYEKRMGRTVVWDLSRSTVFFQVIK